MLGFAHGLVSKSSIAITPGEAPMLDLRADPAIKALGLVAIEIGAYRDTEGDEEVNTYWPRATRQQSCCK